MRKSYQFKLILTSQQKQLINRWLDLLKCQYNYLLAQRFNWWKYNRSDVVLPEGEFCLISCSVGTPILSNNPDWHSQSASLPLLKKERPWYKEIYSQVLQDMVKRVDKSFKRFIRSDSKGKRSGRPRFKSSSRYKTLTFPKVQANSLIGNTIKLPKLGGLKFRKSRSIEQSFEVKTVSITKKIDGYYITFSTENKSLPDIEIDTVPTGYNTVGIDLGLEKLYVDHKGNEEFPQKFLRQFESKLAKLQLKLSDKQRSKKAKRLIRQARARLHLKIARKRQNWHYKTAHKLLKNCEVIAIEDLKIANLKRKNQAKKEGNHYLPNGQSSKSGMNKSFADNAIGNFVNIIEHLAQKLGIRVIKVNPKGTSQHCSRCLNRVTKTLSERWHSCNSCGLSIDRDHNSAILIKKLAVGSRQNKKLPSLTDLVNA